MFLPIVIPPYLWNYEEPADMLKNLLTAAQTCVMVIFDKKEYALLLEIRDLRGQLPQDIRRHWKCILNHENEKYSHLNLIKSKAAYILQSFSCYIFQLQFQLIYSIRSPNKTAILFTQVSSRSCLRVNFMLWRFKKEL